MPIAIHSQARLIAGRRSIACVALLATSTTRATTAASVHDHRNRNRPPMNPAAMASPATTSIARTQYSPVPAPISRSGSLVEKARAVIRAAVRPRATRRSRSPR